MGFVGFFIYKNDPTILSNGMHSNQAKVASAKLASDKSMKSSKKASVTARAHLAFPKSTVKGTIQDAVGNILEIRLFMYHRLIQLLKSMLMINRNEQQAILNCSL